MSSERERIFIWKNYGIIDVYPIRSLEDLQKLYMMIREIAEDWGIDIASDVDVFSDEFKKLPNTHIKNLLDDIGIGDSDEFEYGTGFSELKKLVI